MSQSYCEQHSTARARAAAPANTDELRLGGAWGVGDEDMLASYCARSESMWASSPSPASSSRSSTVSKPYPGHTDASAPQQAVG